MTTAVIGGGISGLAIAFALARAGHDVEVLEASGQLGGTVRSERLDGFITETGPNGFLDKEPAMRRLIDALGLADEVRPATPRAKERYVYWGGRLRKVPASPPAFFKSDILPWSAKLRALGEPFSARAAPGVDESVASFGRRHLGATATSLLIDAMQSGIFAGDVERLSLAACFPRMAELEREHRSLVLAMIRLQKQRRGAVEVAGPSGALCSFEGGLQTLIDALAEALGNRVRLATPVRSIERVADGWRVVGEGGQRPFEHVVLALPAHAAAGLLRSTDSALGDELAAIPYASVAAVHLGYDAAAVPALDGFGFLVPEREQRPILGGLFVSSIFPWRAPEGRVLLTVMVGGARHPERVALPDSELLTLVRAELAAVAGVKASPVLERINRWERGIPQYEVGHLARMARIDERVAQLPGLVITGNAYRGVGMNDCVRNAELVASRLAIPDPSPSRGERGT